MKKLIVLFLFILVFVFGKSQDIIGERGIFGSVYVGTNTSYGRYMDSLLNDTTGWVGKVRSFPTAHAIAMFLQGRIENISIPVTQCQNKLLSIYSVVHTGTAYDFFVSDGQYQIDCDPFSNGSGVASLDPSDPVNDRTDVIYLGTDNAFHVLTGVVAPVGTSVKPLVQGDQIELTSILVKAASTGPTETEQIVYDENTESVVSHIGTSANGADTDPFHLTLNALFGTLTLNDYLIFTKVSGSWDLTSGYDAMTFFIKLGGAIPPGGNLRVALFNGVQQVSNEIVLAIDKNNILTYQGVAISSATFGNLLNSFITSVRFRYTTSSTDVVNPKIDYIRFVEDGVTQPGTSNVTASDGLTKVADDIRLFGSLASPAQLSTERSINLRRKILQFHNSENLTVSGGPIWQFTDRPFSPYQFHSNDTLTANDINPPTAAMPATGIFARRNMFLNSGIYHTQKVYGHYFGQTWNWLDTMSFRTEGSDYNQATTIEHRFKPRGTGRQVMRASHGTGNDTRISFGLPTLVANTYLDNSAGNHIYARGHLIGINSYLIMGVNNPDTLERMVYYGAGSFLGSGSKVLKSYLFAPAEGTFLGSDSSFGWHDTVRVRRSFHAGNYQIGPSTTWASTDKLKVAGNVNITDSVHLGKASLIGDSTEMDFVLRRRTDGALFRIRADLMTFLGGGGGGEDLEATLTLGRTFNYSGGDNGIEGTNSGAGFGIQITNSGTGGGIFVQNDATGLIGLLVNNASATTEAIKINNSSTGIGLSIVSSSGGVPLKIVDGNEGVDKVWTSDANGNGSWQDPGGGGGEATTIGAFQTTSNANGLSLSGTDVRLHAASATNPGGIIVGTGLAIDGSGVLTTTSSIWNGVFGGTTRASGDATLNAVPHWVSENTAPATFTLPSLSGNGNRAYFIKNEGTDNVTVARAGSDQIYTTSLVTSFTIPIGESRTVIASGAFWHVHGLQATGGSGANTALSNLASVAVNTTIASDADNTDDLGTTAISWKDIYSRSLILDGATSGNVKWEAETNGIAPRITTSSGLGYGLSCMEVSETSDFTGSNVNTVQPVFNTAQDVWTLQAGVSYDFEALYIFQHGATSHSVGLSFELGGGASLTSIIYTTICWVTAPNTNTASQTTNLITAATNTAVNAAGLNATENIVLKGTIRMNAGGTVTPSYTLSAAPGGTVQTETGSYIRFCPKGTNTMTSIGNVN